MFSLALILLVCAAVSTSVVLSRMNVFLLDDEGAISIISDETTSGKDFLSEKNEEPSGIPGESEAQQPVSENQNPGNTSGGGNPGTQSGSTAPDFHANPGFMVIDENDVIWGTETEVEIFKVSYEDGEGNITVKSDNGEKVVAPGTENSYTFKLLLLESDFTQRQRTRLSENSRYHNSSAVRLLFLPSECHTPRILSDYGNLGSNLGGF